VILAATVFALLATGRKVTARPWGCLFRHAEPLSPIAGSMRRNGLAP
jgi:hypothetical protein